MCTDHSVNFDGNGLSSDSGITNDFSDGFLDIGHKTDSFF